jgi:hypothetical protein
MPLPLKNRCSTSSKTRSDGDGNATNTNEGTVAVVSAADFGGPPGAAIVASNNRDWAAVETDRDVNVIDNDPEQAQNGGSGGVRGRGDLLAA